MLYSGKYKKIYGIYWFVLSLVVSALNDLLSKELIYSLTSSQITFFRYLFSLICLFPIILTQKFRILKTNLLSIHLIRASLLFVAIISWNYALQKIKLPTATLISFSIPIFTLVFGIVFLKEKLAIFHGLCTFFMFIGLSVILYPYCAEMNFSSIFAIISVICFSLLDVFNKKFIHRENSINMIFYSSLFVVMFSLFNISNFTLPNFIELAFLLVLGINSNLILYFLLKAFSLVSIAKLSPYRYLELVFSSVFSYIFFEEGIDQYIRYGSLIIIPTAYLLFNVEKRNNSV